MEQKINKINYKSDFDLVATIRAFDTEGNEVEIGFMNYDWELELYTGCNNYASRNYKVSYIGGKATNCFNDNGKVHIICDNHKMNIGVLNGTIKAKIPNTIYPDGHQLIVAPLNFSIELVEDAGDSPTPIEVSIFLPYLYDSAYRQAVIAGYKGTQEEYFALASQLPNAVEVANSAKGSADSLAESAEQIGGAIETLGATTEAIEQGANVIKQNADTLQASANIVKTSAEQIGGNINNLQASVQSIDGAVADINSGASAITISATKVESSATSLATSSTSVAESATSLVGSAINIEQGATAIEGSVANLQTTSESIQSSATQLSNGVADLNTSITNIDIAIANAIKNVLTTKV